jgi:hypothetical protein
MSLDSYIGFFKAHERLLLVIVLAVAGWLAYGKYLSYEDKHATAAEQVALAAAQQQQLVVAQQTQQFVALQQQIATQNQTIRSLIVDRNAAMVKQQTQDEQIPLPEVAKRVADLAGFDQSLVTPTAGGVQFTEQATRKTAETLEQIPVLQKNFADEQTIAANTQKELGACTALVASQKVEIAKNDALCKAEVAKVKADGAKSRRKWLIVGFIAGFATGRIHNW